MEAPATCTLGEAVSQKPECKIHSDGTKEWWLNGKLHRSDGPALERANGTKEWLLHGKPHRTNGPAVEFANGAKVWWLNGKWLGNEDEGFWVLWELLTEEERSNCELLQHAPWVK